MVINDVFERQKEDRQRSAEDALVEAAIAGDPAALRGLLEKLGPSVARVVRAVLGPFDMGLEDAVQEALLAFIHALPNFRRDCSVRRFINRIAARTALSARRRKRAERTRETLSVRRDGTLHPGKEEVEWRRRAFVRKMFDELPDAQADVLALRFLLGYSLEETAEAVGAPVNTVRSRIRLAKEAMREHLARDPSLLEGPI
jgi:RNA polymerase sigma-70 factor (ECF subfamily)